MPLGVKRQSNLKVIAANFRLSIGGVILLICQIWKHSCLQYKVLNNFGSSLGPKNCVSHEKNNKIWWMVPWIENDILIPFLLNVL